MGIDKIVITGGGSGGHTIPALVMIKFWKKKGVKSLIYIGSQIGIERKIVSGEIDHYYSIFTGKLRRYFSIENFLDFFKFVFGTFQSMLILIKNSPDVIFSTGGFVALPVVIAGKILGIKVVIHEQTTQVGLANKLSSYFADAICISFKSSANYFPGNKTHYTGYPLRESFYNTQEHIKITKFQDRDFSSSKKILLILGGGNGSVLLNNFVLNNFEALCTKYNVILQSGLIGAVHFSRLYHENFWHFSFLEKEMIQLLVTSDVVVARAGAGTVCELMYLKKACLFIPLAIAQKNEQWYNAQEAKNLMGSIVMSEDVWNNLNIRDFFNNLDQLMLNSDSVVNAELEINNDISKIHPHNLIDKVINDII